MKPLQSLIQKIFGKRRPPCDREAFFAARKAGGTLPEIAYCQYKRELACRR